MNDETYSGWTNWATWNFMLWSGNEEPLYRSRVEQTAALGRKVDASAAKAIGLEFFPAGTPDMDSADEMQTVNWTEVAEHWEDDRGETSND